MTDADKLTKLFNEFGLGYMVHNKTSQTDSRDTFDTGHHVVIGSDMDMVDGHRNHFTVFSFDDEGVFVGAHLTDDVSELEDGD